MSLYQSRVFTFAVIRGFMPLGVAQFILDQIALESRDAVIRGFMPLGVAQSVYTVYTWRGN